MGQEQQQATIIMAKTATAAPYEYLIVVGRPLAFFWVSFHFTFCFVHKNCETKDINRRGTAIIFIYF